MAKETMITYLDKYLNKKIPDYELALDWDTRNHSFEIAFRIYGENKEQIEIDDVDGVASEEEIIEFEDAIVLVDPTKSDYDTENYLAVIPYEGKKGMKKNELTAVVDYLKDVIEEGQSDLLDFLLYEPERFYSTLFLKMIALIIQTLVSFFNQISVAAHNRNLPHLKDKKAPFLSVIFLALNRIVLLLPLETRQFPSASTRPLDQKRPIVFVLRSSFETFGRLAPARLASRILHRRSTRHRIQKNEWSTLFQK